MGTALAPINAHTIRMSNKVSQSVACCSLSVELATVSNKGCCEHAQHKVFIPLWFDHDGCVDMHASYLVV